MDKYYLFDGWATEPRNGYLWRSVEVENNSLLLSRNKDNVFYYRLIDEQGETIFDLVLENGEGIYLRNNGDYFEMLVEKNSEIIRYNAKGRVL